LLEKALAYYHENGDKAFAAFSRQGEFVDKDRYVFVLDTKGVMLASGGPSSALIGRDVSGNPRAGFAESLQGRPESAGGQRHPAGGIPLAELGRRQGRTQARLLPACRPADSGGRVLPATGVSGTGHGTADKAAADLAKDEKGTLSAINSLKGGYLQDDLYVFVVDLNTRRYVAHGTNLRLINTDFSKISDPEGKPVGEPMLALMAGQDYGEYDYRWKNPVTGKVEDKHAYLKKVGHFLVAVGYYSP
jgi:hypothetical protein